MTNETIFLECFFANSLYKTGILPSTITLLVLFLKKIFDLHLNQSYINFKFKRTKLKSKFKQEIVMVRSYLKNYKFVLSIAIFLIIFCILGLPWTNWWFNGGDDFSAIFSAYKIKNWRELWDAIIRGNTGFMANPTNFVAQTCQPSFFSVYFRPLHVLLFTTEYLVIWNKCILVLINKRAFSRNQYSSFVQHIFMVYRLYPGIDYSPDFRIPSSNCIQIRSHCKHPVLHKFNTYPFCNHAF